MEIVNIIIKAIMLGYGALFGGCLILAIIYNIFKENGKKWIEKLQKCDKDKDVKISHNKYLG